MSDSLVAVRIRASLFPFRLNKIINYLNYVKRKPQEIKEQCEVTSTPW